VDIFSLLLLKPLLLNQFLELYSLLIEASKSGFLAKHGLIPTKFIIYIIYGPG
jgi:hypothetical protein